MATIKKFEDLECWQSAQELVKVVYDICEYENVKKDYSLCNQLKRASISVSNNIVEGFERLSRKEFKRFLSIANGSFSEIKNMIYIMKNLSMITNSQFDEMMEMCQKTQNLTKGLIRYLYQAEQTTKPEH
jgi:four helix bundle protein